MTTRLTLDNVQTASITRFATPVPKITSIVYSRGSTFSVAGGQTITVNGTIFNTGITVALSNIATPFQFSTTISPVTVVNSRQITFTSPALTAGTYLLTIINTDGGTASATITYA